MGKKRKKRPIKYREEKMKPVKNGEDDLKKWSELTLGRKIFIIVLVIVIILFLIKYTQTPHMTRDYPAFY